MIDRLLFTAEVRRILVALYSVAALASVVVYWIRYSPAYGVSQALVFVFAALWVRWCLGRRSP